MVVDIYIYIGFGGVGSRCVYGWCLSTAKLEGLRHISFSFLSLVALFYVNVWYCRG